MLLADSTRVQTSLEVLQMLEKQVSWENEKYKPLTKDDALLDPREKLHPHIFWKQKTLF